MKEILEIRKLEAERDYKLHQIKSVFFVARMAVLFIAIVTFGLGIIILFV